MSDAKSEPFVLQYHSRTSGKNYRQVLDILRRVISEYKLEIKVTECAWSEYEALQSELANLKAENKILRDALETVEDKLNNETAYIQCEASVYTLTDDQFGTLMFLRDLADEALEKTKVEK